MKLNTLGHAAMGATEMSVDGVVPAGLVGVLGGNPQWLDDDTLIFQYLVSTGPDVFGLGTLDWPGGSVVNVDSIGQNDLCAGNGNYAAYLAGGPNVGVRTNMGIGPFPAAALGDMDEDGSYVMVTAQATGRGLQAFDDAGVPKWSNATLLTNANVKARNNAFAYKDGTGWHLVNLLTGATLPLLLRDDDVTTMIPVLVGSTLYVVEFTNATGYSIRGAAASSGYVLPLTTENMFSGDAVWMSGTTVRIAGSVNAGELPTELRVFDLNVANGALSYGVTTSGALVFTTQPSLSRTAFTTTEAGSSSDPKIMLRGLYQQAVVDKINGRMTQPWYRYEQALADAATAPINLNSGQVTGVLPISSGGTGNTSGSVALGQTFVTVDNEAATLTNSRQLLPGTGVTFDTSVPNALTVNASAVATADYVVAGDGVQPPSPIDNGVGEFVYTVYTP